MPEANYRITHTNGREVDVYIHPSQLQKALNGFKSYQDSICIIFREERKRQYGINSYVSWEQLVIREIPPARHPLVSRRGATEERWIGECCTNENCGPCGDDPYTDHTSCRYGCTLRKVA